jgi:DNA-binding response OmpR family regulator
MSRSLILIVEDEKDLADLMQFNLRQSGFETMAVQTENKCSPSSRRGIPTWSCSI